MNCFSSCPHARHLSQFSLWSKLVQAERAVCHPANSVKALEAPSCLTVSTGLMSADCVSWRRREVDVVHSSSLQRSASRMDHRCEERCAHLTFLFMVALCNRDTIYIFMLWFVLLSFFFFSSPNLSRRRLDVCHTSTHGVALVRI